MTNPSLPSAFDPAIFEQAITESESSSSLLPIPAGEYNAIIEDYKFNQGVSKKNNENYVSMLITYSIIDDTGELARAIARPPKVSHTYFVDTNASGAFDFGQGKNVWLGKIRNAVGMNAPGQSFSFSMLKGQALRIVVSTEPSKDDPEVIYNRVKSVGRL